MNAYERVPRSINRNLNMNTLNHRDTDKPRVQDTMVMKIDKIFDTGKVEHGNGCTMIKEKHQCRSLVHCRDNDNDSAHQQAES